MNRLHFKLAVILAWLAKQIESMHLSSVVCLKVEEGALEILERSGNNYDGDCSEGGLWGRRTPSQGGNALLTLKLQDFIGGFTYLISGNYFLTLYIIKIYL